MSAKRGDRVAPPARPGTYALRFASADAAKGWEELYRQAPSNTRDAYEALERDPCPVPHTPRHHPLKGTLSMGIHAGRTLERWQYEVTGSGRIWYLADHDTRTCWLVYAGTGHSRETA